MSTMVHLQLNDKLTDLLDKRRSRFGVPRTVYLQRLIMNDAENLKEDTSLRTDYEELMKEPISKKSYSSARSLIKDIMNDEIEYEERKIK